MFRWVSLTTYAGQKDYHGVNLTLWNTTLGGIVFSLAVNPKYNNVPVLFNRDSPNQSLYVKYDSFYSSSSGKIAHLVKY